MNPCTADNPNKTAPSHPDAVEIADYGDYVRLECPNCGKRFNEELPQ